MNSIIAPRYRQSYALDNRCMAWAELAYHSNFGDLVYPYFLYCNFVWASSYGTNLIRLEILQKRVIRTIAKTPFDAHTDSIFQNLGILKFHDMYLIQLGLFMYSYQNHTLTLKFSL